MSQAATKEVEPVITPEMMKDLKSRHRRRFDDAAVKRALAHQFKTKCTLDEAAATEGMTGQTLAARRDQLAKEMGITDEEPAKEKVAPAKNKKR